MWAQGTLVLSLWGSRYLDHAPLQPRPSPFTVHKCVYERRARYPISLGGGSGFHGIFLHNDVSFPVLHMGVFLVNMVSSEFRIIAIVQRPKRGRQTPAPIGIVPRRARCSPATYTKYRDSTFVQAARSTPTTSMRPLPKTAIPGHMPIFLLALACPPMQPSGPDFWFLNVTS